MKLLNTLTAILFAASMLTACGGKDKKDGDKKDPETKTETTTVDSGPAGKLEGAWIIKRAEGNMRSMNEGTVYEFKGSKLTFSKDGFKNPGTTEVTDSTFSFQADGNKYKFMYDYRFNGDTLVVSMQNSDGQLLHMVKE
jgi:major membrane immunogen (membrane-anchored lipoprotein)